ncbi:MAG: hypothetical protein CMA59_01140 [Euryarchaeota archaeon]|nr:hypothetical protein [Euryarchaeota archaeon]
MVGLQAGGRTHESRKRWKVWLRIRLWPRRGAWAGVFIHAAVAAARGGYPARPGEAAYAHHAGTDGADALAAGGRSPLAPAEALALGTVTRRVVDAPLTHPPLHGLLSLRDRGVVVT